MVVVEGLGPQCSDPVRVFRFISPDLCFLSALFKDRTCAATGVLLKVAFTTFLSKFSLETLSTKKMPTIFHGEKYRIGNYSFEL